jgi:hypothetical protein
VKARDSIFFIAALLISAMAQSVAALPAHLWLGIGLNQCKSPARDGRTFLSSLTGLGCLCPSNPSAKALGYSQYPQHNGIRLQQAGKKIGRARQTDVGLDSGGIRIAAS